MRRLALIVVFVSVTVAASGQGPKNGPTPGAGIGPAITIHLTDIPLSRALRELGELTGFEIALASDVADSRLGELMFVNAAFEDVFVSIVHGQCLSYKVTGTRSILVTRSSSGGKSETRGPRVVTWPDCSEGYTPPARPQMTPEGLRRSR